METYSPLFLMGVGMATVFAVLWLVIETGKLLIWIVNRFAPEEVKKTVQASGGGQVDPTVRQAIDIAVRQLTGGKKGVSGVEKL